MINSAEDAVKAALKLGAKEAEAYAYEGQATNIGIELGQISKTNRIIDRGLGHQNHHQQSHWLRIHKHSRRQSSR